MRCPDDGAKYACRGAHPDLPTLPGEGARVGRGALQAEKLKGEAIPDDVCSPKLCMYLPTNGIYRGTTHPFSKEVCIIVNENR